MAVGSVRDLDLGRIGGWCEVQGPILGKTRWQVRDSGPRLGIDVAIVRYIVLDWEKKVAGASLRPGSYGWKVAGVRFRALDLEGKRGRCEVKGSGFGERRWHVEVQGAGLGERRSHVQGSVPWTGGEKVEDARFRVQEFQREDGRCEIQGPGPG